MTAKKSCLLVLLPVLLTACSASDPIAFEPYSDGAVEAARSEGQPMVIKATADW